MRKVFAGILLALSLPAMAQLNLTPAQKAQAQSVAQKLKTCGSSCNALIAQLLSSGVSLEVLAQAASESGTETIAMNGVAAFANNGGVVVSSTGAVVTDTAGAMSSLGVFMVEAGSAETAVQTAQTAAISNLAQGGTATGGLGGGTGGGTGGLQPTGDQGGADLPPVIIDQNAGQPQGSPT